MINDEDSMVSSYTGSKTQFFGPEDSISLSLEYYQVHLDKTPVEGSKSIKSSDKSVSVLNNNNSEAVSDKHKLNGTKNGECKSGDKRYLQCPAAVSMKHLQKFIRMKFALSQNHKVDIIYEGEVLHSNFTLMDVAYTFKWKRLKPLRFFYRIFTPLKIQPIKIVNSGKQLQIVKNGEPITPKPEPEVISEEKERLLANLQLQSKTKVQNDNNVPEKVAQDCVFDYEEQDKEEIKRFAEIRDREWALQKKLDESREKERDEDYHHFSKKRKKSKHSKNDCVYKKRKLHAEITNEEELKLKVKLTPHNGHKHKHHKSEMSSKEKLLQMRQVRHKHVTSEDKNVQTASTEPPTADKKPEPEEINGEKKEETKEAKEPKKPIPDLAPKTLRSDFPAKTLNKEWGHRVPTVQIERNEQTEQQAKKTFLKSYQAYAEKYQKTIEKTQSANRPASTLERKIANLQQRCTIEAKPPEKPPQYPPGFTVSKIESGVPNNKEEKREEKRPSLEITLINPPEVKPPKRPPPATIPLDRIKKSLIFKTGISIIPKDNIGALDLSAKPPSKEGDPPNGFAPPKDTKNLSNLQMLSKVATEHPSLNKPKPRPQLPNLQTLKIPSPNQRIPPNLKLINKGQFRMMNPQIRNLRPNQNQSIRNIPNPSLVVRQQQNRINSMNPVPAPSNNVENKEKKEPESKPEVSV
ncbi:polycomb group protein Psc isoform X2 [Tribolium castaneum]|uniref:polycomb group protein Psc isoform X2 n=1 Tax=Tribolium castaneum TaxID=7070 RepID=UPI0030FF1CAD